MPASPRIASTADVARRLQPVDVGGDILAYSYVRELHRAYGVDSPRNARILFLVIGSIETIIAIGVVLSFGRGALAG